MNFDTNEWNLVARGAELDEADVVVTSLSSQAAKIPSGTRLRTADGREFRVYRRTWWRTAIWAVSDGFRSAWRRLKARTLWSVATSINAFYRWRYPDERVYTFWPNRWVPKFLRGKGSEPSRYFYLATSHFQLTILITDRMHITFGRGPDPLQPANPPDTPIGLLERAERPSARRPPRV